MIGDDDWQNWDGRERCTRQPNTTVPSPIPPWHRPVQSPQTQTCTGDDTISLTMDTTYLDQVTPKDDKTPYVLVIPNGSFARQIKRIYVKAANTGTTAKFKLTGTFQGFGWLMFSPIGWSAVLEWVGAPDGTGAWTLIGGNADPQN